MKSMQTHGNPYLRLGIMVMASFASMYVLMYAMVDELGHVLHSLNQIYMAALMTAPMIVLELALMGGMYPRKAANAALAIAGVAMLALSWAAIRSQAAIGDRQFLRSMIPHHAGAVLMCGKAPIHDAEIRALCAQIARSQRDEIAQMNRILERLER